MGGKDGVHWLNAGLMLLCCLLAYAAPIKLLLFSYAILGPAHYLTELSWLHDRRYFAAGTSDALILAAISLPLFYIDLDPSSSLIWAALAASVVMAFVPPGTAKTAAILAAAAAAALVGRMFGFSPFWTMMLPTLIHVFVFTGLFLLAGAVKEGRPAAFVSAAVFAVCGASFFFGRPFPDSFPIPGGLKTGLDYFMAVDGAVLAKIGAAGLGKTVAVMAFMSYAYTYHYLNWFSKVELIQWHRLSRARALGLAACYVLMAGLFLYDYKAGFMASTYLSLLHVLLEFPLDCRTAGGLFIR